MCNHRIARLLVFIGIVLAVGGCHKKTVQLTVLPPASLAALPEPPPPPPPPSPAEIALEEGNRAFEGGMYPEAFRAYNEYLEVAPGGDMRDEVLFRLALISTVSEDFGPDWQQATTYLNQLVAEFPQSPLRIPATLIVNLHSELITGSEDIRAREERIRQLTNELSIASGDVQKREERIRQLTSDLEKLKIELEKLKKIDAERRKRP